jgi:hypothetical protein
VDSNVLMLARMYARRRKGYNLIGYTIRDASNGTSFFQRVENRSPKSLRSTEKHDETEQSPGGSASPEAETRVWDKSPFAQQGEVEGTDRTSDRGCLLRRRTSGFSTMIEEYLALPFRVKVLGVVDVEKVDMTLNGQIVAICRRGKTRQKIPILDLPLPTPAPAGVEWIVAYRHWRRGSW